MVRKHFKQKSKRVSTRTRVKIERKVRDHNRKIKKEKKNTTNPFKRKKDVNIPNNCPFKDKVLKEAEVHKRRVEDEREHNKQRRKKQREMNRNKNRNLNSMVTDAQRRTAEFDRKAAFVAEHKKEFTGGKTLELSLKQYYREFKKVVESADVILQVLDARDPLGSRCPQVEEAVLSTGTNKRLVLLLNKVDLVPKENVEAWLKHLRNEFPTIAFKASTQSQCDNLSRSKVPLTLASDDLRKSSRCLGAELLLKLLGNYCRNKDIRTSITVGVVGFPNTGKSSIINSLKRSKACNVGAAPGITRSMQVIQLDKHIKLLDSPGIVMATGDSDSATILKNCVKVESLADPVPAADAILRRCTKQKLMMQYGVPDFSDVHEFLALLARKQGRLRKHGVPDSNRAAKTVILDWNQGRITYYTHPPETNSPSTHLSAQIVTEMSKEFDIDSLVKEEAETLKGLKQASSTDVVVATEGPTQGKVIVGQEEGDMEGDEADMDDDDSLDDDEDEWEDEEEAMEAEATEADNKDSQFTVAMSKTSSKKTSTSSTAPKVKDKPKTDVEMTLPGNQQVNKSKKKDLKKMKKQRKRSDAVAGDLSNALEGALGSFGPSVDEDGDYNFDEDFK